MENKMTKMMNDISCVDDENNLEITNCSNKRCKTCVDNAFKPRFESTVTKKKYLVHNHTPNSLTCASKNVIYLVSCTRCGIQYVGETSLMLRQRMNGHRYTIMKKKMTLLA
jgi:tripartite motif-containing protein 2/3